MTEPGFTKIIHEPTGNIAEVPESSLGQHYAAGWAPLDEEPEPAPAPAPAPVKATASKSKTAGEPEITTTDEPEKGAQA